MGCNASKPKRSQVLSDKTKDGRTGSSSGLQAHFDLISNCQFEPTQSDKEKGSPLRTSFVNSPDTARAAQQGGPQKTEEKLPSIILFPPKDAGNHELSLKGSPSFPTKEQELGVPVHANMSLVQSNGEISSSRASPTFMSNLSGVVGLGVESIENKTQEVQVVPHHGKSLFFKNSSNPNGREEDVPHVPKLETGMSFSFMQLAQSTLNHPTIFFSDQNKEPNNAEAKSLHPANLERSADFNSKANEVERLPEIPNKRVTSLAESVSSLSCSSPTKGHIDKENLRPSHHSQDHGSLGELPEEAPKGQALAAVSPLVTVSTNVGSYRTITSLGNLGMDEVSKAAIAQKFTQNLVNFVKPPKGAPPKFTRNLVNIVKTSGPVFTEGEQMKANTAKSLPVIEGLSNYTTPHNGKSQSPLDFTSKCRSLSILENNENMENRTSSPFYLKGENRNDQSFDFSALEMSEHPDEPSPINGSLPLITRPHTANTPMLSNRNSSFSRYVDTSNVLERTIHNLEDQISRIDLDKYSIHVETHEEENLKDPENHHKREGNRRLSSSFTQEYNKANQYKQEKNKSVENFGHYLTPDTTPKTWTEGLKDRPSTPILNKTSPSVIETSRADKSVDDEGQKKINQYLLIKEIGRGGFGKVKLAINCDNKKQYAIKIANKKRLKKKLFTRSATAFTELSKEVAIMKKMDHPNIVKLFELIDDPNHDNLYLVMEYIKKGAVMSRNYWKNELPRKQEFNLQEEVAEETKKDRLSEDKAKKYFRDLILALDYLHNTVGVIHRDIKPENLLISSDDTLKVSDFGISVMMEDGDDILKTNAGTKLYLAPETWEGKSFHGKPADIWAAGGTLYYFLYGKAPFQGFGIDDLKRKIIEEEPRFPEGDNVSPEVIKLIKQCLEKDPVKRIKLDEIMENPWLTDCGKNPLRNNQCMEFELNDEDINKAFTNISFMAIVYVTATLKKAHQAKKNVRLKRLRESQKAASLGNKEPLKQE